MEQQLHVVQRVEGGSDPKRPWESKTMWVSLIVAMAPFFPPAQAVMIANPEAASAIVGAIFAALRLLSTDKVKVRASRRK